MFSLDGGVYVGGDRDAVESGVVGASWWWEYGAELVQMLRVAGDDYEIHIFLKNWSGISFLGVLTSNSIVVGYWWSSND